ncbi:gem-associated protein 5 [Hyalella azteca]|uniref:Gem-associated protein 5 n=1 Tax=Hyalella azteca TaxID=294128 RepID=A0A8B7PJ26_HYAAZ|nr:gem-associated protein 5 [Hyalella azteca]
MSEIKITAFEATQSCQIGSPFLPPAPNWFSSGSADCRPQDRLLVTGAFKSIVLYRIPEGPGAPQVLKSIYHAGAKVLQVRLFPDAHHARHGSSLLVTTDQHHVTLYNADTGAATIQHAEHVDGGVNGICFSVSTSGEVLAVSVGGNGRLVLWNVDTNITKTMFLNPSVRPNLLVNPQSDVTLTLVEVVPDADHTVIVAAQKIMVVVDVKSCQVLYQLKGHEQAIYTIRWWTPPHPSVKTPFTEPHACAGDSESNLNDTKRQLETASGPYFASSDHGRNILLWNVASRRFVCRTQVAPSDTFKKPKGAVGRSFRPPIQHVALAWYGNRLLANTAAGVIISIPLSENASTSCVSVTQDSLTVTNAPASDRSNSRDWRSDSKTNSEASAASVNNEELRPGIIHREHTRVLFNLNVIGSILVSCGQDRNLVGYCLDTNKVHFSLPTLGGAVHSLMFDPRDSSWLAMGLHEDSIKLINLNSSPPLRSKAISGGIKGKVLSLSWHPKEDGFLLYGTSDGQVGIANVNSGKVTAFAFFHQRPAYKVEWAPAVLPQRFPEYAKSWCAFSVGDREIVMRNTSSPMADPVKLTVICPNLPDYITEFSFSPDHKFLAIGCQNGRVSIVRSSDLIELVKIVVVRKTIQHLLWKPVMSANATDAKTHYYLAMASSESKICLLDLTNTLPEQNAKYDQFHLVSEAARNETEEISEGKPDLPAWEPLIMPTCTRELCGHASRVVWLCFSKHNPNLLASASYDHTCQIWDTSSGEQVGNYRGHLCRLYRVEFSPTEADLLYSFGEENSIHQWRYTDLIDKSPPGKIMKLRDAKPKIASSNIQEPQPGPATTNAAKPRPAKNNELAPASGFASKRVASHKSLFPLLHHASCYKRGFILMSIMCMHEQKKLEAAHKKQENVNIEDLLEAAEEEAAVAESSSAVLGSAVAHYPAVLEAVGAAVMEAEDELPRVEDIKTFVDFYGSADQTASFLDQQIASHMEANNLAVAAPLHLWRGTSEALVRQAISSKSLTADIVVQALHASRQLGETACEAFSQQLVAAGDIVTASSYLIMANKVTEAIELLQQRKLYREALVLAKTRRPGNLALQESIAVNFAKNCMAEGQYDIAAILQESLGDTEAAASCLSRRGDLASLVVAGLLYHRLGSPMADATLLEALRTSGSKGQLDQVLDTVLAAAPQFKFFSLIAATVREYSHLLSTVAARGASSALMSTKPLASSLAPAETVDASLDTKSRSQVAPTARETQAASVDSFFGNEESKVPTAVEESAEQSKEFAAGGLNVGSVGTQELEGETQEYLRADINRLSGVGELLASLKAPKVPYAHKIFFAHNQSGAESEESLLERILRVWLAQFSGSELTELHAALCSTLNVSLKPSSLKQYQFLLGIEVSKLLLRLSGHSSLTTADNSTDASSSPDIEAAAAALQSTLQLAIDWDRFDQIYEISHILLPKGIETPPTLLSPLLGSGVDGEAHPSYSLLCKLNTLTEYVQTTRQLYTPFKSCDSKTPDALDSDTNAGKRNRTATDDGAVTDDGAATDDRADDEFVVYWHKGSHTNAVMNYAPL